MAISDTVLLKPDRLNSTERELMERHPVYARDLLMSIPYLRPALDIPYCHHEKWDGTGYPRRLQGEQIPLAARIFAVVDVWDALTQDRPYRRAWSEDRAREYIRAELGRHFDPRVGEAFLKMLVQDEVSGADDHRVSMLALLPASATAADALRGMHSDRVAI
jgi:HD-GYP domain-containing protein (c-di-GMP phosphodiesterase class II)